jgi:hypothetical protein
MSRDLDLFILGTPFCGSTLLGNALNAHPDCEFLGELNRIPSFRQFEGALYRDGQYVTRCAVCGTHETYDCPVWTEGLIEEYRNLTPGRALEAFRWCRPGKVLVEGSKNPRWLRTVLDERRTAAQPAARAGTEGVRVLHCVRNPFAFALSYKNHTSQPARAGGVTWRDTAFDVIRTCAAYGGLPTLTVQYEAFALHPEATLRRICEFIERPFDVAMLRYWEVPAHPLGGNYKAYIRYPDYRTSAVPHRARLYEGRPFGGWADERWLSDLRREELTEILFNPGLADAAGLMGYDLAFQMETFFKRIRPASPESAARETPVAATTRST